MPTQISERNFGQDGGVSVLSAERFLTSVGLEALFMSLPEEARGNVLLAIQQAMEMENIRSSMCSDDQGWTRSQISQIAQAAADAVRVSTETSLGGDWVGVFSKDAVSFPNERDPKMRKELLGEMGHLAEKCASGAKYGQESLELEVKHDIGTGFDQYVQNRGNRVHDMLGVKNRLADAVGALASQTPKKS